MRWTILVSLCSALASAPALAAKGNAEIETLRGELEKLRAEQAATAAKIDRIENALNQLATTPTASQYVEPAIVPHTVHHSGDDPPPFQVSGDIRLRYEANFGDRDARNRDRAALRARLRASYAIADWIEIGGEIATGDPDDPNSSDVTLSNFDDDLAVSLDQAWLRLKHGKFEAMGGKIPLPFVRTDMVWDGDVYPQGLAVIYRTDLAGLAFKASSLYFFIDESAGGKDSRMIGGQAAFSARANPYWKFDLATAYYDYRLGSVAGGDAGDFRSNRFANGRYLSDFNLLDINGSVTWTGLGARWPIKLNANYVHNFGATTDADSGYLVNVSAGRMSERADWRVGYGYAQTGTDAVFAAFSEDNTSLASNYIQHSLLVEYTLRPHLILNGSLYRFKPKNRIDAGLNAPDDWLNRLRINLLAEF
jgi:Putative porin